MQPARPLQSRTNEASIWRSVAPDAYSTRKGDSSPRVGATRRAVVRLEEIRHLVMGGSEVDERDEIDASHIAHAVVKRRRHEVLFENHFVAPYRGARLSRERRRRTKPDGRPPLDLIECREDLRIALQIGDVGHIVELAHIHVRTLRPERRRMRSGCFTRELRRPAAKALVHDALT